MAFYKTQLVDMSLMIYQKEENIWCIGASRKHIEVEICHFQETIKEIFWLNFRE